MAAEAQAARHDCDGRALCTGAIRTVAAMEIDAVVPMSGLYENQLTAGNPRRAVSFYRDIVGLGFAMSVPSTSSRSLGPTAEAARRRSRPGAI